MKQQLANLLASKAWNSVIFAEQDIAELKGVVPLEISPRQIRAERATTASAEPSLPYPIEWEPDRTALRLALKYLHELSDNSPGTGETPRKHHKMNNKKKVRIQELGTKPSSQSASPARSMASRSRSRSLGPESLFLADGEIQQAHELSELVQGRHKYTHNITQMQASVIRDIAEAYPLKAPLTEQPP